MSWDIQSNNKDTKVLVVVITVGVEESKKE